MVREAKITERIDLGDDDHFIWIRLWENNEAGGSGASRLRGATNPRQRGFLDMAAATYSLSA